MLNSFIPVANPKAQYEAHKDEIAKAINKVLSSGWYILGEEVKQFEQEFSAYLGIKYCAGVANGTDALAIALKSVGIAAGDEVITVSHTAVATVAAIEQIGAVAVFTDIDPLSRCLDPHRIQPLITARTKAIVPVHIYGQPASMSEIVPVAKHFNLKIIEDCAQAHGAEINGKKAGTFGDAGVFSFYPTKNLGAIGDGGAVVTNSPDVAQNVFLLRQYGWKEHRISFIPGGNSRLDELQAAILRVKLPHLPADNERRRKIAEKYCASIDEGKIRVQKLINETLHAMHLFVVECDERDSLGDFLKKEQIETARHYPMAVHQQPAYKDRIRGCDNLPVTESMYKRILSLPMYPELTELQVHRICTAMGRWLSQ